MRGILRRLRGAVGNALVWGGVWSGTTFTVSMIYTLAGLSGASFSWSYLKAILLFSGFQGAVGFVTGGAFSAYFVGAFRGRSLDNLNPWRAALGGALVTVPFVLLLKIWSNSMLGYEWIFLSELLRPVAYSAALGGLTAFSSVRLAQSHRLEAPEATHELRDDSRGGNPSNTRLEPTR
jgi:hypothetical protein